MLIQKNKNIKLKKFFLISWQLLIIILYIIARKLYKDASIICLSNTHIIFMVLGIIGLGLYRSEERRVGKECS